jgi:uncharacterized protein
VQDLYLPFRPKRATRAAAATAKGLKPLAAAILNPGGPASPNGVAPIELAKRFLSQDVKTVEDALAGARQGGC